MFVNMLIAYKSDLRCHATIGPWSQCIETDAPAGRGRAECASPVDLVAAGLSSCILTTMGMAAQAHGVDLSGARAHVQHEMSSAPRRISQVSVRIKLPTGLTPDKSVLLHHAAATCPVTASFCADTKIDVAFVNQL